MSIIGNAVTLGGGGEPALLWTNPSPSAAFSPQTVSLAAGYSGYLVEFYGGVATSVEEIPPMPPLYVPVGLSEKDVSEFALNTGSIYSWQANYARAIVSVNDGSIQFGNGRKFSSPTSTSNVYNANMIPIRIWGVKWTL